MSMHQLQDAVQPPSGSTTGEVIPTYGSLGSKLQEANKIYVIDDANWYKNRQYGFVFRNRNSVTGEEDASRFTFWLPINPNNLTVTTHFATNLITTLYGIVEEHSEVRYYDITISGTTGYAPNYYAPVGNKYADGPDFKGSGRASFDSQAAINLGGFLPELTNTIGQVMDAFSDVQDTISGTVTNKSGITFGQTGYAAFHNLYRFFLQYKRDTAGIGDAGIKRRKVHPIQFLNYKDGIKYDCVPMTFTLVRSAESPMLYNYNIRLRAYNLRNVSATPKEIDQLSKLGLGGLENQSAFSQITGAISGAVGVISAIGGAF